MYKLLAGTSSAVMIPSSLQRCWEASTPLASEQALSERSSRKSREAVKLSWPSGTLPSFCKTASLRNSWKSNTGDTDVHYCVDNIAAVDWCTPSVLNKCIMGGVADDDGGKEDAKRDIRAFATLHHHPS